MTAIQVPGSRRTREDIHVILLSLYRQSHSAKRDAQQHDYMTVLFAMQDFFNIFTFEKLLLFSVNDNMSTSGNLKGEKNVDFDNFMMIAYI